MKEKKCRQMSDSMRVGAILAIVGGFLDAYTYLCRGNVFANAQTGNIVLLGVNLFSFNWKEALNYFIPILAFASGIFVVEEVKKKYKNLKKIHWRQIVILFETILLIAVSFIPESHNLLANTTISFICSLQVDTFRKVRNNTFATTMCTGNLRSGTALLCTYIHNKDKDLLKKSLQYYAIILVFIFGGGIGAIITSIYNIKSVLFCCALLLICFLIMFIKEEDILKDNH